MLSEVVRDDTDPQTGQNRQYEVNKTQSMKMEVGLPDILAGDGSRIIMRGSPIDFEAARPTNPQTPETKPKLPPPLINSPAGLLDDSWMNRLGWSCGRSPRSRILVFDRTAVYGFGFTGQYQRLTPYDHHLYAADRYPGAHGKPGGELGPSLTWSKAKFPLLVRALVATDGACLSPARPIWA